MSFLYVRFKNGCIRPWQCPSDRLSVCPLVWVFQTFFYIHSVGGITCWVSVSSQLGHFDWCKSNSFFSCDQAALWMVQSICLHPSVRLSVCLSVTPFSLCFNHCIITKFWRVITIDTSDIHAKGQGQRPKDKVTEVMTLLSHFWTVNPQFVYGDEMMHKAWHCIEDVPYWFSMSTAKFQGHTAKKTQIGYFRTVTPVWIYQWLWNDAQCLKQHKRGALLNLKVIRQIWRSQGKKLPILTQIAYFRTVTPVWIQPWLWNDAQSLM